ncbi:autotransporter domain-containing protein [Mesorhizobium sp. RP14(2022)]|uniref:Autotransporter domain-containing protein n=1 Tax=Mesorhizobium liriopis TaxID=2953882 RepID=A0ABT1CBN2_9HYPH|nr:autotransporter domain-containing protein [Mesorhizobium liriopis]MCO6052233.1 autotransporter domain-containing protein [Mesorhizobium liriopis]
MLLWSAAPLSAQQAFAGTAGENSSLAAPFAITAQDVTYSGTDSAGNAALTTNQGETVTFDDDSTAANATIINNSGGATFFNDRASGGSALITVNRDSRLSFNSAANAAGANVTVNEGGRTTFAGQSSAGNAGITNNGTLAFSEQATGGQSDITNNASGTVSFSGDASSGNGRITNNGTLSFTERARAAGAFIVTNEDAQTTFSGNSSADTAAFTNNGSLAFSEQSSAADASINNNGTGTVGFSGNASAGTSFIANSGTVALTGNASAASAEIVNNKTGRLVVSGNATLGETSINNGGELALSGNASAGSASIVTGPDAVTRFSENATGGLATLQADGGGTVDFSGVSSGQVSAGSIAGPGTFRLGANRLTVGGNNASTTVDGVITDGGAGGSLVKTGTGTLTLSGTNSYRGETVVRAGTLQTAATNTLPSDTAVSVESAGTLALAGFNQRIGSLKGAGTVDLSAGSILATGANNADTTFSGTLGGSGGLVKQGAGRMSLSGTSTYSGATTVEAGELAVSGLIASSSVVVLAEGILSGAGTVGTTSVSGTLSRQSDGETLTVAGDLSFPAGSVFAVALTPGADADLVTVQGTASLDGGKLVVSPGAGFTVAGSRFRLISAASVTGTFADEPDDTLFLSFDVDYGATAVDLAVARNGRELSSVAQTPNQRAVGQALEEWGLGAVLDALLLSGDEGTARNGLDSLSGEIYADIASRGIEGDTLLRDLLSSQAVLRSERLQLWAKPFGAAAGFETDGNAAAFDATRTGVLAGADVAITPDWLVGLAGGYSHNRIDLDARGSEAEIDSFTLAAYGQGKIENWNLSFGALHSWHGVDVSREVALPGLSEALSSDFDARSGQVWAGAGYPFKLSFATLEPFTDLSYAWWDGDGWSENGVAGLASDGSRVDGFVGTLGLRGSTAWRVRDNLEAAFSANAGWRFAAIDGEGQAVRFVGGPSFSVSGLPADRNALALGGKLRLSSGACSAALGYDGMFGDALQQHTISANLNGRF